MKNNKPLRERFKEKYQVNELTGCFIWTGALTRGSYGTIKIPGKRLNYRAHRLSYELSIGPIPMGMQVCHKCDNPKCVNPEHLFIGTISDNMKDCILKNRHRWRNK